jgi:hypothetical protein
MLFGFLAASISHASDLVVADAHSRTIVFRMIAVSGQNFDEQYVVQRCRQFLKENKNKKLIRFTLFPDEPGVKVGVGCDHCEPYRFWRTQYDEVSREMFPIGELMAFGPDAVLRFRTRSGTVTEMVLNGIDPRSVEIDGFVGKIVHVGMSGRMPMPLLHFFVVGSGP